MFYLRNRLPWRSHVLVLTGYLVLTLLMTYPLAWRMSSQLAGSGDDMWLFQWNNWWLRKALSEGLDPYFTRFLFHPYGASLVYHNFSWLNSAMWLVLEPLMGSVAAYNFTFLLTFVLCGYATYVLVFYLTRSHPAAFVAGLVFAFSPYHLSHYNHPNLISVQWLPFCVLFLIRTVREGGKRNIVLCVLSLVLTALSRWQLLTFAAILMGLYLGYSLLFERKCWNRRTVWALLEIGLSTAISLAFLFYPLVTGIVAGEAVSDDVLREQEQDQTQTDLLAYIVPNRLNPLFGSRVAPIYDRFRKNRGEIAFLGYSVLLLSGYGAWSARRNALYWVASAGCLLLLALGPTLRLNGHLYPAFPMPYRLVGWLLPIEAMRMPDRFNVALSLPLAVLAGYGVICFQESFKRRFPVSRQGLVVVASSVVLAGIILFEYMSVPLRTTIPLDSPFYRQLAREVGDFAILDVPMGRGYSKAYMFLQTLHGKRLVEGHISRTPSEAYNYIRNQPLLRSLAEQNDLDTSQCDVSRRVGALAADDIRYIVIHKVDVPQDRLAAWRDYLTIRPIYEDDGLLVYRTHPLLGQDFEAAYTLGGGMALVQATVTPTQTTPGGILWVDLRWTTIYTPTGDYVANLALVDPAGVVVQEDTAPLCNNWPTYNWGSDALVVDQRQFQISPYLLTSNYQLDLSIVEAKTGQVLSPTQTIATVEVEAWERRFVAPPMQRSTTATFGETLTLLGYDLHQTSNTLYLTLHWQALRRPDYYKVFVHLYDSQNGNLVEQSDTVPRQWTYPTNWWEAGEVVSDEISFDLNKLPAGRYRLMVGVYEPDTGTRLSLPAGQDHLTLEELSFP